MRAYLLLILLLSGGCVSNKKTTGSERVNCFADGHGPYSETQATCRLQGERQAYVNCVLGGKDAEIIYEMRFIDSSRLEQGRCMAKFNASSRDCQGSRCEPLNN